MTFLSVEEPQRLTVYQPWMQPHSLLQSLEMISYICNPVFVFKIPLVSPWSLKKQNIAAPKNNTVNRNQGANIYHLHTDMNIRVALCACKHRIVNTTQNQDKGFETRETKAPCKCSRRVWYLQSDLLTERGTTSSINTCVADKYLETENMEWKTAHQKQRREKKISVN